MLDDTTGMELLRTVMCSTGMKVEAFDLSLPHWKLKRYKKGEFYNEYKNVCKHLGFIISGVFRIYRVNESTGEEKNMLFLPTINLSLLSPAFLAKPPANIIQKQ